MGFFKKFKNVNESQLTQRAMNNDLDMNSPYDVGYAFASLVTCAAIKNYEQYYMALASDNKNENTLTLHCSNVLIGVNYEALGVPMDVAILMRKISKAEVKFSGTMDIKRMMSAFERGINTAIRKPYICNLKSHTGEGVTMVQLDVSND